MATLQRLRPILACDCSGSIKGTTPGGTVWMKALKKHPQYYALRGVMLLTVGIAALSGLHAIREPEVVWRHHSNPEPWNAYANKQYKLWSAGRDYSQGCPAPKY